MDDLIIKKQERVVNSVEEKNTLNIMIFRFLKLVIFTRSSTSPHQSRLNVYTVEDGQGRENEYSLKIQENVRN